MLRDLEDRHKQVMFRDCRRPQSDGSIGCVGGRLFWGPAEQEAQAYGFVGSCSHCGWQIFSGDILNNVEPLPYVGKAAVPFRRNAKRIWAGPKDRAGWKTNNGLFAKAS